MRAGAGCKAGSTAQSKAQRVSARNDASGMYNIGALGERDACIKCRRNGRSDGKGEVEGGDEETVEITVSARVTAGSGIEQVETMKATVMSELNGIALDGVNSLEYEGVTLDVKAFGIGHRGSVLLDDRKGVELVVGEVGVKAVLAALGSTTNDNTKTGFFAFFLHIQGATEFADAGSEFDENVVIRGNMNYARTEFDDASDDLQQERMQRLGRKQI